MSPFRYHPGRQESGSRDEWPRPSLGHRASLSAAGPGCIYGQNFRDRVRAMAIRRSSLHRNRRGRTPTSSASSARSAASVSITSSFSMRPTCAAYCRRISLSPLKRAHLSLDKDWNATWRDGKMNEVSVGLTWNSSRAGNMPRPNFYPDLMRQSEGCATRRMRDVCVG